MNIILILACILIGFSIRPIYFLITGKDIPLCKGKSK